MTKVKKKSNWYATVNRGSNNIAGTKIKLTHEKHPFTMEFLKQRWDEIRDLHVTNPEATPSYSMPDEPWGIISKELKIKNGSDKFTKIYYKTTEICVINHIDFKLDITQTELLRIEAQKQREHEEAKAKKEEAKKKREEAKKKKEAKNGK